MNVRIRSAYEPSEDVGISFEGQDSLTQQHFKDECDVNNILARYDAELLLNSASGFSEEFVDLTDQGDYLDSMMKVVRAQEAFEAFPAKFRARFNNSPAEFLAFVDNPENNAEMISLGLLKAREASEPTESASPSTLPT